MREHIERLEKALFEWRAGHATTKEYQRGRRVDIELLGVLKALDERLTAIETGRDAVRAA